MNILITGGAGYIGSLRRLFRGDTLIALWVSIGWQILLLFIGVALAPQQGLLGHMDHWDAGWYLQVIQSAYGLEGSPAAPAFYPLFPFIIGVLQTITFDLVPVFALALFVNTTALWMILLALFRILRHFTISKRATALSTAALLAFPSAFFLHVFYSEALFIALAFWVYYAALRRRWWLVGTLLAILTASRLPSLLFVVLCGVEYLRSYNWDIKKAFNKTILWLLLAPIGFITYGLYLLIVRGNFFAMFQAYSTTTDWIYHVFNPNIFATLYETALKIGGSLVTSSFNYEIFINDALPLASIIVTLAASIFIFYKLKREGIPLFVFGILSVILFTLNSNVISVHRYTLACIVIYIALGLLSDKRRAVTITLIIGLFGSFVIQVFLYSRFINNIFAG